MKRVILLCLLICTLFSVTVFGSSHFGIYDPYYYNQELHLLKIVYCEHPFTHIQATQPVSCDTPGYGYKICSCCGRILRRDFNYSDSLGCTFGDWVIKEKATPLSNGVKVRNCIRCDNYEEEVYNFNTISNNFIYIPTADIHSKLYVGALTQSNIDKYDLVYNVDYYGTKGPWVLGHQYGTLKNLYKVKIGDIIYIGVGNNIKSYIVRYSEFALQNERKTDIVGQTSNLSVLTDLEKETLHLYTCYGKDKDHRWMVLAELQSN